MLPLRPCFAISLDEIEALAVALGALDAEHVALALDVAEDEIGAGHAAQLIACDNMAPRPGGESV